MSGASSGGRHAVCSGVYGAIRCGGLEGGLRRVLEDGCCGERERERRVEL